MTEIIYIEMSYRIIGACFEVYKEMGCGFLEPVYQECLEKNLPTNTGRRFTTISRPLDIGLVYCLWCISWFAT